MCLCAFVRRGSGRCSYYREGECAADYFKFDTSSLINHIYLYICIVREREREKDTDGHTVDG